MLDFLKKNLLLIAFGVVSLIVSCILAVRILGAAKSAGEYRTKVGEQYDFLNGIKDKGTAVTEENKKVAEVNHKLARRKFLDLRKLLRAKSRIPEENPSAERCVVILEKECQRMLRALEEQDVEVAGNTAYFSFDAEAKVLPHQSRVIGILKQLRIIQEIVRLVGESYLAELRLIDRPLAKTEIDDSREMYGTIPFEVSVVGELKRIQRFVNQLQRESRYLFFIRHLSLDSDDQAEGGNIPLLSSDKKEGGGSDQPRGGGETMMRGRGGMGPDGMMMGGERGMEGSMDEGGEGMQRMMMAPGMRGGSGRPMMPPGGGPARPAGQARQQRSETGRKRISRTTREERAVFEPHLLQASIRLDFVEFHAPTEEN